MKILLLKAIKGVGQKGEIKEVAEGFARNFILPQKLGVIANENTVNSQKKEEEILRLKAVKDLKATQKLAEKLRGLSIIIKAKANDSGKLYAAITASQVVSKLKEKGIEISKDKIIFKEPVKESGDFMITASLDHSLDTEFMLTVEEL